MNTRQLPRRGEVWLLDLGETEGHEQAGMRPAIVVSADFLNQSRGAMAIVVPLTSVRRNAATRVQIDPPDGGVRVVSYALCDAVRSVSIRRFVGRWGTVSSSTIDEDESALKFALAL